MNGTRKTAKWGCSVPVQPPGGCWSNFKDACISGRFGGGILRGSLLFLLKATVTLFLFGLDDVRGKLIGKKKSLIFAAMIPRVMSEKGM